MFAGVVGGGPAGLIAAERLAGGGFEVTVYDHTPSVGRKLLLAGRSGLNLTHGEPIDRLLARYGEAAGRLEPHIRAFDADALRAWCEGLGIGTFVGSSGRVFPDSYRATPLLRAWLRRLDELGVRFATRHRWEGWDDAGALRFSTPAGPVMAHPDVTVLALGGASWPRVGSDGGWVPILTAAGIAVSPLGPANVRVLVDWSPVFADRFAGTPLKHVALSIGGERATGDPVINRFGLESGPVYAIGRAVRRQLDAGDDCVIEVDLAPDLGVDQVAARLARRRPKDSASNWLRRSLGLQPAAVALLREAAGPALPAEPSAMATLAKAVPVRVRALDSIDRAISTAGGVSWGEVDEHLMLRSRPGCYVAGEMIDWEAPTGGYLLQACFSTGVAAAQAAVAARTSGA